MPTDKSIVACGQQVIDVARVRTRCTSCRTAAFLGRTRRGGCALSSLPRSLRAYSRVRFQARALGW
jgi:hypothetical protein